MQLLFSPMVITRFGKVIRSNCDNFSGVSEKKQDQHWTNPRSELGMAAMGDD
jgi:hypothetical protein